MPSEGTKGYPQSYPLSQAQQDPNSAPLQGGNNGNAVSAGSYQFQPYATGNPFGGDSGHTLQPFKPSGENTTTQPYFGQNAQADAYAGRMGEMSSAALNASAPVANLGYANQDRDMYGQSYGAQQQALSLAGQAAQGRGPSAAQSQFGSNLNAAMLAQQSAANSARGGGAGLAAAQQQGQMQQAQMAGQGAQQAAMLRAQEMQQAQQQYQQMSLGMGAQNLQAQGQDAQNAFGQAQLQAGQNQLNQQGALQWAGLGQDALQSQLQSDSGGYQAELAATSAMARQQNQELNGWGQTIYKTGMGGAGGV